MGCALEGIMVLCWRYIGVIMALCWRYVGVILVLCWYYGRVMDVLWTCYVATTCYYGRVASPLQTKINDSS